MIKSKIPDVKNIFFSVLSEKYELCPIEGKLLESVHEAMKSYGKIVRDITLDEAAAKVEVTEETNYMGEYWNTVDKNSILKLKSSDELKIE